MSAVVKQEVITGGDAEQTVLQVVEAAADGIDMDALTLLTSSLTQLERQNAINSLLGSKKLAISQAPGGVLRLKVNTNTQIAGTAEEQAIYSLIEESKTRGIWIRELRDGSGLNQLQLRKTLKTLETKKLIKTIKAVGTTKKCYMLFDLEPDMSLTGGTFYSDQQLDSELINTLISVCGSYANSRRKIAIESNPNDIQMQRESSYIRPQEIADFITEKRVLNVPLSVDDLQRILDVAVLDGTIERRSDGRIRACPPRNKTSPLVSVPCSVCPVVEDCRPGFSISPETCENKRENDDGGSAKDPNNNNNNIANGAAHEQPRQPSSKKEKKVMIDSMKASKTTLKGKAAVEKWVSRTLDMGVPRLVEEFRSLAKWTPEGMTTEAFNANKDKNRYQDVPCQDKGRVVLKFPGCQSDYIHANYVGTARNAQRFICAQGPLENTQYSFWAMAIQEKVECIIMLCNCIEMTKIKCHQYWPAALNEKMTFGDAPNQIHVTNVGMRKLSDEDQCINVTNLKVDWAEGSKIILHYQWENWPDRGVPMTKLTATNLLSAVRGNNFPILVHCSAGIGRTGTIVALAYVQEKMQAGEDCMAMNELLKELRMQRPWSIQNEFQYLYLHRVLLAYFLEKYRESFSYLLEGENAAKFQKWCEDYKAATGGD
ncbi:unnamed protein product [Caenorhabditis bovis]|uniref:Protein-tyrosine-phosphatase n=1 Tax=Caenorhabditis bovis TaxID=2654633 RepID=A0A8S1F145_9PELO|nr:unnamed protein product [Caenorhabditis bovis]